jgi:acyl dehydratase
MTHQPRKPSIEIGDYVSKEVEFSAVDIPISAATVGDTNPLHHDATYAATTRFGGLIASGAHVSALMLGMVGDYFADKGLNVGLEFTLKFQAPVRAGDKILMRWRVEEITPRLPLRGKLVKLQGEAVRHDGRIAVSASGMVLSLDEE